MTGTLSADVALLDVALGAESVEQIARDVPAETGDRLRSITDELEDVRGERLHEVIEGLAPELGSLSCSNRQYSDRTECHKCDRVS